MKNRRKIPGHALFGAVVQLSALPVDDAAKGVWNVLAYEVDMASGVKLAKADFEACVQNFGRYPKVPLVIEHADTDLFGKAEWAEPHGWIAALRVGEFTRPDGRVVASLEGRVQADATTRLAINGDDESPPKWPFGSVTVFRGKDEETGTDVGMCLWSFSLTAHPRLVDVPRLAAARARPGAEPTEAGYYWGTIESRDDLVEALRCIFELPALPPEADVLAQLDRFEQLLTGDAVAAEGVDLARLLGNLREALRLPALSTAAEVVAEVRKGLALPAASTTPATMSRDGAAAASTHGVQTMKTFLEMAAKMGLAAANEDDAREKVLAHIQAAGELFTALGARSPAEAAKKLTELQTAAAKLPEVTKERDELRKERDAQDAATRAQYVDDVLATEFGEVPEAAAKGLRASFELHAKHDFAAFQAAHPLPERAAVVEKRADASADQRERAQDGERLAKVSTRGRRAAPAADVAAGPTSGDLIAAAKQLQAEHEAQGAPLSFSEAVRMIEGQQTGAPLAAGDDEGSEE